MDPVYIIAFGLLSGLVAVFSREAILWLSIMVSMVLAGLVIMIAPNANIIKWAITMTSAVILVIGLGGVFLGRNKRMVSSPFSLWLLFAFMLLSVISLGLNFYPVEFLAAGKNMFQYWGIPLVFYYLLVTEKTPKNLAIAMLVIAAMQPVVAAMQHYLLRGTAFSGDRVGGTFGGALGGTGGSAELSMFLVIQFFVLFALAKYRVIKGYTALILGMWFLMPLLWTQAKAVVVMIPLGMLVLYADQLRARPMRFIGAMSLTLVLVAVISVAYFNTVGEYYKDKRFVPDTFGEFVDKSIAYNVGDKGRKELNRTSAIAYWWQESGLGNEPLALLFGHGLGAAKMSGSIMGHLYWEQEYRFLALGITFLTRLLWEVGIIGTMIYFGIFISIFRLAGKVAADRNIPVFHRAILSGYQAGIIVIILSIPYQKGLINNQAFAAFSMFVVGYVLFWHRYRYTLKADEKQHEVRP